MVYTIFEWETEVMIERDRLLRQAKLMLRRACGDRMRGIVLYGSRARGDASADSDVDMLVLLAGPIHLWEDIRLVTEALYPLQLRIETPLEALPVDADAYDAADRSLYRNAKREGIRV